MAILTDLLTNDLIHLLSVHQFGRHQASCNTELKHSKASRIHATITWDNGNWSIQDNSVNGTFVNNQRLTPNRLQPLNLNDVIHFVSPEHGKWQLTDTSAPKSMLIPETPNAELLILDDIVVLPNQQDPQMSLYLSQDGKWICENAMGSFTLTHNNLISVKNTKWRFVEATSCDQTIPVEQLKRKKDFALTFKVSQDEEHIDIIIEYEQLKVSLGERNHHYLMLLLAREYLNNKHNGYDQLECGWISISDLIEMLQLDETNINMQIYRFRKQILKHQPNGCNFPQLIERRKGLVRLYCDNIDIQGGMKTS